MLAKLLKRKESRQAFVESSTTIQEKGATATGQDHQSGQSRLQYRYQRPDLLGRVGLIAFYIVFAKWSCCTDVLKFRSTLTRLE